MELPKGKHNEPVVRVQNLAIAYETHGGDVNAVRDVSFEIHRGETLGLVGESGCGKSTVAYGLVNYLGRNGKIVHGEIIFQGESLVGRSPEELRRLRGDQIAMVYQDPMTSLNPVLRVGQQMTEVLTVHRGISEDAARARCVEMLHRVYMPDPEAVMGRYPHQISGGQQQRVVIAMALLNNPALLVMDEPTTALDVTVEAAVLDLIADLRRDFDTAILFISHNLGVVARVSSRVGVMYAGEMVEQAPVREIFAHPRHPYTQGLMRCVPRLGADKAGSVLYPIRGRVPAPNHLPPGCVFEPRCDYATEHCRQERPALRQISNRHMVSCLRAEHIRASEWRPTEDIIPLLPAADAAEPETILNVDGLRTYYRQSGGSPLDLIGLGKKRYVRAVDGVSFTIPQGKTLGVVGESGCGKSTLIKTLIGLEPMTGGEAQFLGFDLEKKASQRDMGLIRELQMVFQNPDATMNPSYSVGTQIERPLRRFKVVPTNQVHAEVVRLLRAVKLDEHYYDRRPRQLSGGEKQRVGIARAFAGRPDLVLCDEPVSALDVSVQAAVLNLLLEIQREQGTTMIFIAHDLSVVRFFSDYVAVMYLGQIVEIGPAEAIYAPPYHPYTESLLAAVPIPDPSVAQQHIRLEGSVPSPLNPPSGCRFHTRCPRRQLLPDGGAICEREVPPMQDAGDGHQIHCHIPLETLHDLEPVVTIAA
ncbi:ABC transporter ATP-binding protein [Oscillochloris sp. ZM17-4]|uniref:dipeptide ABC transporter ATP-binding protein n=1 Tax=Oscillochloris sp. ZM17-4 TaxID=2866714 RepID=UPI001C72F182|nr:ABC transporter ATP-binding protein [Oscillochloris sp. ZM17-4]MBX0328900.1 ABC transporter ATP-binding protein [Oscillochloris sp. ZM17-4]